MKVEKRFSIAFTSVFAIVILLFITFNISNVNVSATGEPTINPILSKSVIDLNSGDKSVKISANIVSGSGTGNYYLCMYQYKLQNTSDFIMIKDYSTDQSVTWTPPSSGIYTIRVSCKTDTSSAVTSNKQLTVMKISNTSTINKTSVSAGETVTVNGSATGGSSYQYKYTYTNGSGGTKDSGFIDDANKNYSFSESGTYVITITAKDKTTGAVSDTKTFRVNVADKTYVDLTNTSTLNKNEFQLNEKLVVQASASGGSGNYQYKYEMCDLQGIVVGNLRKDFSSSTTYSIQLAGTTDSYMIRVTVKDTKTNKTVVKKLTFTIKDKEYPSLTLNTNINTTNLNTPNNSSGNDLLKIQASASGGDGKYKYTYKYIKDNGTEKTFGEDLEICESKYFGGLTENASFDVQILKAGTYKIMTYAQDSRGITARSVHTVTVYEAPQYTKAELSGLIIQVENWYERLTPSQQTVFSALTEVNSEKNFEFDDWETALDNAKKVMNSGSEYDVDAVYKELEKQQNLAKEQKIVASEASSVLFSVSSSLSDLLNWLLTGIGGLLTQNFGTNVEGSTFGGFDIKSFVDTYSPIFMIFANSLLVLLFAVNVISTTLQYELFTLRGACKTFEHLLLAKVWIDLSCTICFMVIDIAGELLSKIITKADNVIQHIDFSFAFTYNSGIWLVGQIIDFIVMALILTVIFLMFIPLLFFLIKVIVKLFIMNFELAALTAMSPVFFACLVGEETKQYFKNFVMTFLSVVVEVVFMGIVYAAFINWYSGFGDLSSAMDLSNLDIGSQIINFGIFAIVFIAACSLMIKPPQVFKNLIR